MKTIKVCEYLFHGARTVEHTIDEVVAIRSTCYLEPEENNYKFIGYDYPTIKNRGSLVVHLKNGETEVYPASNWQIEF